MNGGEDEGVQEVQEEIDPSQYKLYDFRTADKFSKEQIRTFNTVFESYCNLLNNRLTTVLRTTCEAKVLTVEEQKFGEFSNSIPIPSVIGVIDEDKFDGSFLIVISSALTYAIITKIFGGIALNTLLEKEFSEIDLAVIRNLLKNFVSCLKAGWEKIENIDPSLQRMETSSRFAQIASNGEAVLLVAINVKIDEVEDLVYFCIPHVSVQPILKKFNTTNWALSGNSANKKDRGDKSELLTKDLNDAYYTIKAMFNETAVTFGDIANIKVGDLLRLDHRVSEYINIKMEDKLKYKGIVGVGNNKKVVQIAKIVKEGEQNER